MAAALAIIEAIAVGRNQRALGAAEDASRRAEVTEAGVLRLVRGELDHLQKRAGHLSNERVSLFRWEGDHFILVGRRSPRPAFDRSPGRESYPASEGCLGRAWDDGTAEEQSLPDPGLDDTPRRRWLQTQSRRWAVPETTAAGFTMRSQSYAAFRVESLDRQRSLGVIVFESTLSADEVSAAGSKRRLSVGDLKPLLNEEADRLAQVLEACAPISEARVARYRRVQAGASPTGPVVEGQG